MRSIRPGMITITAAAALMLAACENGDEPDQPDPEVTATDEPTESEPTEEDTDEPEPEPTDEDSGEDGTSDEAQDGAPRIDEADLPGEETAMFFSTEDLDVAVVGVSYDDVLYARALPGASSEAVGELPPTGQATLAGRERLVEGDGGLWAEIQMPGGYAWVNSAYLGYTAATEDVTAEFSEVPPAADPAALAESVGQRAADDATGDGGPGPEVTVVGADSTEDGARYWVDVLGLGDDAVLGMRYEIAMAQDDGYAIDAVSRTYLCGRGVGGSGDELLCT